MKLSQHEYEAIGKPGYINWHDQKSFMVMDVDLFDELMLKLEH